MAIKLILEIIDPNTECPMRNIELEVPDLTAISSLLGIGEIEDHGYYWLDAHDTARFTLHFNIPLAESSTAALRRRARFDDLPYQIHTNRELLLMLNGVKPLAAFAEEHPCLAEDSFIPERLFDPYVAAGRFIKREYVDTRVMQGYRLRRVLYARPEEAWRIDAYILLCHTQEKTGWNDSLERMEGHLLGYEEWQTDVHMAARKELTRAKEG
jgi:hypothetical protein